MPTAHLSDRAILAIDGPEAEHFLQNIITTDLDALALAEARPGALLTPQGKIMFDFLVSRPGEGLRLDCRADVADDLLRRLTLYRLRAKVGITRQEQGLVAVRWGDESAGSFDDSTASPTDPGWFRDMRFSGAEIWRGYGVDTVADATAEDWQRLRITHGIAESGTDYELGDAFPHDVLLDETGGIGFRKGCYIGQEVVSRMQHRGTARRRVMMVEADADLPAAGTDVRANDRPIGKLGSVSGRRGLAIVRIDKVKDALDAGQAVTTDSLAVALSIPPWAKYTLPQNAGSAEEA